MSIYEFDNYKHFVVETLKKMPKKGYGQFKQIASHLSVNSVIVSQVFKGSRQLNLENALDLAEYLGLNENESEYFVLLVELERAGTHKLKRHFKNRLEKIKLRSTELSRRVVQDRVLSEEERAVFYSSWYFSGIRLLTDIKGFDSVDSISEYLKLPRSTVKRALEFLLETGLCIEEKNKIKMGPKSTHLDAASPFIARHHTNWRLRGIQNLEPLSDNELFYSGPMSLSMEDSLWVRKELVTFIERIVEKAKKSNSEQVACLNIDWFNFKGRAS